MVSSWIPLQEWEVGADECPSGADANERLRFLIRYAVLAPSSHNAQPWLFRVRDEGVELYADRSRALPAADPNDRELTMSCGAALLHLRLALRHFGHAGAVEPFPDPENPHLLARVRLGDACTPSAEDEALFRAIPRRRTNRLHLDSRPPSAALLAALQAAAHAEGAWLEPIQDASQREALANLIAEGDRAQEGDPRYRHELGAWVRANDTRRGDGIPGYAYGIAGPLSHLGPFLMETFNLGGLYAARDRQAVLQAPLVVALGTSADTPPAWLAAGQALARVLLLAATRDVWAAFFNQAIQVAPLRPRLAAILATPGFPQLVFRLGHGEAAPHTPRRPLPAVVSE